MSPIYQQHLNSDNMRTIDGALARVRSLYRFDAGSEEEQQVAAVMIGEFQLGNTSEEGLFEVFLGLTDTATHARRKRQMQHALQRWEDEGGAVRTQIKAGVAAVTRIN